MLRQALLLLSQSEQAKHLASTLPVSSDIVGRYVPGEGAEDAVEATRALVADGLGVTLDYLGEDTHDERRAQTTATAYVDLLGRLADEGLAGHAEVSVKLSAIGQSLPETGARLSLEHARTICRAARNAGTTVTLDMEDHTTTSTTLATLRELRKDYPETGGVVQSALHRTERDCHALVDEGSRVRLCKGAYAQPETVAFQSRLEIDRSYVRCLRVLLEGDGYPMIATHDPRLVDIALALARRTGRKPGDYEFQMLFGIRPDEQRRLARAGERVRVYVPYGEEWYGYLMRRLAERPANAALFARSLLSRR